MSTFFPESSLVSVSLENNAEITFCKELFHAPFKSLFEACISWEFIYLNMSSDVFSFSAIKAEPHVQI